MLVTVGFGLGIASAATMVLTGAAPHATGELASHPDTWPGKPFVLLPHVDVGSQLSKGKWLVILVRSDCPRCQAVIREYESAAREKTVGFAEPRVVLLDLAPGVGQVEGGYGSPLTRGRVTTQGLWGIPTPLRVALDDGVVVRVETCE